jgi:hypothetical protein
MSAPSPRLLPRALALAVALVAGCDAERQSVPGLTCDTATCDPAARCDDASGSPVCTCASGYVGDGQRCAPFAARAFALMDAGDARAEFDAYLAMESVDGLAVRLSWSALEPADDVFSWTRVDEAFAAAAATGKRVTLHVLASTYVTAPAWLYAAGAQSYSYTLPFGGPTRTDPVPWDPVLLAEWSEFLAALRAHVDVLGASAALHAISVAVPVPEMSLVGCRDGVLQASPLVSYSRAAYLAAWQATVDAATSSFPDTLKLLPVPVGTICWPDADGGAFYSELWAHAGASSTSYAHYATDLTTLASDRLDHITGLLAADAPVGVQFIWSYSSDPTDRMQKGSPARTFLDAVCRGYGYGADYFEVYKVDVASADASVALGVDAIHDASLCP